MRDRAEAVHSAVSGDTKPRFAGVPGVLPAASPIAALLRRRIAHGRLYAVIDDLTSRMNAWWAMVAVLGAAFAFGRNGVVVLFLFVSYAALREYVTLAYMRSSAPITLAGMFYLVLPILASLGGYAAAFFRIGLHSARSFRPGCELHPAQRTDRPPEPAQAVAKLRRSQ